MGRERTGDESAPISAADSAAGSVRVADPGFIGGVLHVLMSAPDGTGGTVLVACEDGAPSRQVSPAGERLGSSLYLYGATAWCATAERIVAVEQQSQQLVAVGPTGLTPLGDGAAAGDASRLRHGDLVAVPGSSWVVVVRERPGAPDGSIQLVAVDADSGRDVVLFTTGALIAEPAVNPSGDRIAWVEWRPPAMPWDAAALVVATLDVHGTPTITRGHVVDGGAGCSVGQPTWLADGSLAYVSEAAGYWQPWLVDPMGSHRRLTGGAREFQGPRWRTRPSLVAMGASASLACAFTQDGIDHVATVDLDGTLEVLDQPCVRIDGIAACATAVGWVGATAVGQGHVGAARLAGGHAARAATLVASRGDGSGTAERRKVRFVVDDYEVCGLYLAPAAPAAPLGAPPLVLTVHPGPTGSIDASCSPLTHLLTAHGYAVASIDYSGSTGHGRRHRDRLLGRYGELDVHECVAAARHLAAIGLADPDAMWIRGTSAGGTTALLALTAGVFRGAVAWYPESRFAPGGDAFESGYLAALLGCRTEADWQLAALRGPIARAPEMRGAALVVQGADDPIVDAADTTALVEAMRRAGVATEHVEVDGEGHGLRTVRGRTIALSAELAFYRRLTEVPGLTGAPRYDHTTAPHT